MEKDSRVRSLRKHRVQALFETYAKRHYKLMTVRTSNRCVFRRRTHVRKLVMEL